MVNKQKLYEANQKIKMLAESLKSRRNERASAKMSLIPTGPFTGIPFSPLKTMMRTPPLYPPYMKTT